MFSGHKESKLRPEGLEHPSMFVNLSWCEQSAAFEVSLYLRRAQANSLAEKSADGSREP